jgi:hypothetical protein
MAMAGLILHPELLKKKNEMERGERVGFEEIRMEEIRVKG